ncbi:unnamed protein product [Laminaria digitata]
MNAAIADRRAKTALSLKTGLFAELAAAEAAVTQTAYEAIHAGRALESERCNASHILAARQRLSDQDPSSPPSRSSSSLPLDSTSPLRCPSRPVSLAASSPPERLGSPSHSSCWRKPADSCSISEEDIYGTVGVQQLAPSRPADTEDEPDEGGDTDIAAVSVPGKYSSSYTPAVWAGMTAAARATHVQVVRAAKESAKLELESLEDQASADAVATAKRNVSTALCRLAATTSLKDNLRAKLVAAESAIILTAHNATFTGQALDSEKRRASRILADRQRLSTQDLSSLPSWPSSPPRHQYTKRSSKCPRTANRGISEMDPAAAVLPTHQET